MTPVPTSPGRPRALRSVLAAAVLALSTAVAGCERGQDDEVTPRPTRTVTVTPSPTVRPPEQVPVGDVDLTGEVVWAQGSTLHLGRRAVDLAPVTVEGLVATSTGAYVLAEGELWSVDLRRAEGTRLPDVARVGVSTDGASLLVDLVGDRERRAYDVTDGRMREGTAPVAVTEAAQRAGPGEYAVTAASDGTPVVTTADGTPVEVDDLPVGFEPRTWPSPSTVAGTATAADGTGSVVRCRLDGDARCTTLGEVEDGTDEVWFAAVPLPG